MEKLKPREIFIKACGEIAVQLQAYGFKPTQKGQTLKKLSADKDLTFEVYFQSSHYNYSASIEICPHICICSKKLAELMQDNNKGLIFCSSMSNISPKKKYFRNLAGLSYNNVIAEIVEEIINYAFPIFDIFENSNNETIANFLTSHKILPNKQYIEFLNQRKSVKSALSVC